MAEANKLQAKPDANGNVIVELGGRRYDVTALVNDGVARAKLAGEPYEIHVEDSKPAPKRKRSSARKGKSK